MKQIKRLVLAVAILVFALFTCKVESKANNIIINDNAGLLTNEQRENLYFTMEKITEYGGVAFVTNPKDNYISSASDYAKDLCHEYFNGKSGTVLLIDMCNRRIEIFSTGDIYKKITKQRANIITSNTYAYATLEDYYSCATETFNQMLIVLEGGRVSTPLKYLSNLFLAFGISVLLLYFVVYVQRSNSKKILEDKKEDSFFTASKNVILTRNKMLSKTKSLHVESSGGGGSSSGGGGGGGSSSGGGGGGGHSF